MAETRDFTGVFIPVNIWVSKELTPTEKMLLGEIDALSKKTGWCHAGREHFARWLSCDPAAISYIVKNLEKIGFLEVVRTPGYPSQMRVIPERFYGIEEARLLKKRGWQKGKARAGVVNPIYGGGKSHLGGVVNPIYGGGKSHLPEIQKKENLETTLSVVSAETTAFSSLLESEMPTTASDAAWAVEVFEPPVTEIIAPPAESASDTQPGDLPAAKHAYTPDFEAFWKSYNYCAGSKLTASKRWARLSAKEKALASDAIPAHLRATTTDKARRKDTPFLPMRCHAAVYLSEKRWEAYGEQTDTQRSDSTVTAWDEKYKIYLRTCQNKWPDTLACIAYLSKPEYCAFQERKYIQGIGRIGEKMQVDRLTRCHDRWEAADPAARNYQSVWAYFLNEMANCIRQSNSL